MKVDLHSHGIIGFHDFWLERQAGGLETNLLKLIADECFEKDVGLCAITSQYEEGQIDEPLTGLIHDRFGYLCREAERLPKGYNAKADKENILLVVEKAGRRVGILNSQSVGGRIGERRVDTIVVGSNRVPVAKPLDWTLDYAIDNGFINIGEHIKAPELFSIEEYIDKYLSLEWNAQMIVPSWMRHIPVVGKQVRSACRRNNKEVIKYAKRIRKPVVPVSDAHRIEDIGIANIDINHPLLNSLIYNAMEKGNGRKVLDILYDVIKNKQFNPNFGYESFLGLVDWRRVYSAGVQVYLGDEGLPEGQRQEGDMRLGNRSLYLKEFK